MCEASVGSKIANLTAQSEALVRQREKFAKAGDSFKVRRAEFHLKKTYQSLDRLDQHAIVDLHNTN